MKRRTRWQVEEENPIQEKEEKKTEKNLQCEIGVDKSVLANTSKWLCLASFAKQKNRFQPETN